MKILAIDTSNYVLGISLVDSQTVVAEYVTNHKKNQSVRVMQAIENLFEECDWKPSDLERIVVAHGPGSYTGVRIGVTIAKTLAYALQIPLVGVSSLETLARGAAFFQGIRVPIFDARRGQVYAGIYKETNGELHALTEDRLWLLSDLLPYLKDKNEPILFMGNDVSLHEDTIKEMLGDSLVKQPTSLQNPRPSELALTGASKEPKEVHTFEPQYLRLAEAEANWLAQQKENKK